MAKEKPLGVRLNNPGNLEWGSPWEGLVPRERSRYYATGTKQQRRFCEFTEAAFGIRAIARTLITYYDARKALDGSRIDTVREVIERWAPGFENNVDAYARHVASLMSINPDQVLNIKEPEVMKGIVKGIIAHENGGYAYPEAVVDEGLRRAGIVPKKTGTVPVSTEVVAGSAIPAAAGISTLWPVLESIIDVLRDQQENITSGQVIRISIGVVLVLAAGAVAWSQIRKRRAGSA